MSHLVAVVVHPVLGPVARWAEASQRQACRNAMTASTALTAHRRERDETQQVVESLLALRSPRTAQAPSRSRSRLG